MSVRTETALLNTAYSGKHMACSVGEIIKKRTNKRRESNRLTRIQAYTDPSLVVHLLDDIPELRETGPDDIA